MRNYPQPTGTPSMVFCSLFVAALSACGGGNGGAGAAATAGIASSDVATGTPVAATGSASAGDSLTGNPAAAAADDSLSGVAVVSIASADTDPANVGTLAVASANTLALPIAVEGGSFNVPGTVSVRFGVNNTWTTKSVTGSGLCTAKFFGVSGSSPARSCQVLVPAITPMSAVPSQLAVGLPAAENASFFIAGTVKVQYGANGKSVTKSVTGRFTCSNAAFGSDPIPYTVKSCAIATTESTLPQTTATLSTAAVVNTSTVSATSTATTTTTTTAAVMATTATTAIRQIGLPAKEGETFSVDGPANIQFGADGKFVTKLMSGQVICGMNYFETDPNPGAVKTCSLAATQPANAGTQTATSASASTSSLMPYIDKMKIAAPVIGWNTARIMAANVADPGSNPAPADIGAFREWCTFSHMNYDDPIVAPGGTGSHLHTFLGNTGTNGNSTAASLAGSGNSTCAGGILNRTAYWVPSMIDTTDGTPQIPEGALIYYKQGYDWVDGKAIKPFPAGLRMIAGNAGGSVEQDKMSFNCIRPDGSGVNTKAIPTDCAPGSILQIGIIFPQCWDGVNLDSPDHKSHMAYPVLGCPKTHPVPLMNVTYLVNFKVGANGTGKWRLSSDNYPLTAQAPAGYTKVAGENETFTLSQRQSVRFGVGQSWIQKTFDPGVKTACNAATFGSDPAVGLTKGCEIYLEARTVTLPGGLSAHGDWFNGWDPAILNTWVNRCIVASMDCHAYLIGDGRMLY